MHTSQSLQDAVIKSFLLVTFEQKSVEEFLKT